MSGLNLRDRVKNKKLNLSGLNITEIPVKEIAPLKINYLDLSNNRIMSADIIFTSLTNLVRLDLSNNQISSLSDNIGSLKNLVHLSLANNRISQLPKGLCKLKQLKYMNLCNNPLKTELIEAIGPSHTTAQSQTAAARAIQFLMKDEKKNKKRDKKIVKVSSVGAQNDIVRTNVQSQSGNANPFQLLKNNKSDIKTQDEKQIKKRDRKVVKLSQNDIGHSDVQSQSGDANAFKHLKENKSDIKTKDEKYHNKKVRKNVKFEVVENDESENKSGLVSKVIGFVGKLILHTLLLAVFSGLFLYALSYYDKKVYDIIMTKIVAYWSSAMSSLDPQIAAELNYHLQNAGASFDVVVQTSFDIPIKSYKWVKGNPTVQQYAKKVEDIWQSFLDKAF